MEIKELIIGNWYDLKGQGPVKMNEAYLSQLLDDKSLLQAKYLDPIVITEKLLDDFTEFRQIMTPTWELESGPFTFEYIVTEGELDFYLEDEEIVLPYVHQLQDLFRALRRGELIIRLDLLTTKG